MSSTAVKQRSIPFGATGFIDPALRHRSPSGGWRISAVDYTKVHARVGATLPRAWCAIALNLKTICNAVGACELACPPLEHLPYNLRYKQ
jgi:hypothetical protein